MNSHCRDPKAESINEGVEDDDQEAVGGHEAVSWLWLGYFGIGNFDTCRGVRQVANSLITRMAKSGLP
jgi:hypothetical protein